MNVDALGEDVPLLEGIRTARSIRRLRPDPVPPALIRKVCEAGTFAPSGGNRQPWIFVAVTEPERRARDDDQHDQEAEQQPAQDPRSSRRGVVHVVRFRGHGAILLSPGCAANCRSARQEPGLM